MQQVRRMRVFSFVLSVVIGGAATAQGCPGGIPSAGNPGCIPPDRSNSPYSQPSGGSTSSAPRAVWADRWGAIAVDEGERTIGIGIAEMASSERLAKKVALNDCRAKGGTKCVLSLAYYDQCGVIVWGSGGRYNTVSAETIERASKRAIERCSESGQKCEVYYSGCSLAERIR